MIGFTFPNTTVLVLVFVKIPARLEGSTLAAAKQAKYESSHLKILKLLTFWKFNIAPEKLPSQKETHLLILTIDFQGLC